MRKRKLNRRFNKPEDCHVRNNSLNKNTYIVRRNLTDTVPDRYPWRSGSKFLAGPAGGAKWAVVVGTVVVTSTDIKDYIKVFLLHAKKSCL